MTFPQSKADQQAMIDKQTIAKAIMVIVILWSFVLLLPWISLSWFPVKSPKDVERIKLALSEFGTYGDLFGMLNCLFTGFAFVGAGYAVVLQNRQLRHQQKEIDEARVDREKAAAWEHRSAMLSAISFLAQTHAMRLAALPSPPRTTEIKDGLSVQERETKERARLELELNKYMEKLSKFLDHVTNDYEQGLHDAEAFELGYRKGRESAGLGLS
jgi:hypothetical protein